MIFNLLILLCSLLIIKGKHFNGGTINWAPINPYNNSTSVPITITQTYSWTYPYIRCSNNVPTSTPGWGGANFNLTCVVDCSTDGGYSTKPINILTDCTSASTSLSMLSSTRSKNVTLNADAHFYLAYLGTAWVSLNYPPKSGLEWSIVTFIDLRMQSDGFINTPPVATVISPQYAFVNQTIQIPIPVSDVNAGDDVRCRWSRYTTGYRKKKRSESDRSTIIKSIDPFLEKPMKATEFLHIRRKRDCSECGGWCKFQCPCYCTTCENTGCGTGGEDCEISTGCFRTTTTTTTSRRTTTTTSRTTTTTSRTTTTTSRTTTTTSRTTTTTTRTTTSTTTSATVTTATTTTASDTTTVEPTTTETLGTLKSTSSFPKRQAIDECGGICFPGSLPNGTTLSNCTITFTGTRAGVWYGVAVQVEDFVNKSSTTPMSSIPVQFLIYVLPQPACSKAPVIFPLSGCLEVRVGVSVSFSLYAMNLCNRTVANLTDIIVSDTTGGMSVSNLTSVPTNSSLSYVTITWTPQANQVGFQEICAIAYTSEKLQSDQYCEIFTVKNSADVCVTTTTTTTSTTTQTTTSTTQTTTTSTSTTTSVTTSTTSITTTTSTTSTSTTTTTSTSSTSSTTSSTSASTSTSTTSTTSTTTSTTSTSTSTSTSSTSSTSSSTSTSSTSTSTSTSTTSTTSTTTSTTSTSTSTSTSSTSSTSSSTSTSSTSTSTTTTSATTTTVTTSTTTTATARTTKNSTNWLLILGLSLLALLLVVCCICCCLYWCLWYPGARRRRRKRRSSNDREHPTTFHRYIINPARRRPFFTRFSQSSSLRTDSTDNRIIQTEYSTSGNFPNDLHPKLFDPSITLTDLEGSHISTTVSVKRLTQSEITNTNNIQQINANKSKDVDDFDNDSIKASSTVNVVRVKRVPTINAADQNDSNIDEPKISSATSKKFDQVTVTKVPRSKSNKNQRSRSASVTNIDQLSMEMQPIVGSTRRSTTFNNGRQTNTNNGVRVQKVPRKIVPN